MDIQIICFYTVFPLITYSILKKKEIFLEIDGKENSVSQKVSTKQLIQSQMIALEQYTVYLFVYWPTVLRPPVAEYT